LIAITVGLIIAFISHDILIIYFIVGGIQLLSSLLRVLIDHERSKSRVRYERALLWLFGITLIPILLLLISPVPAGILIIAFLWLLITPVYAISYVTICLKDIEYLETMQ
jgi:hypothetical protein